MLYAQTMFINNKKIGRIARSIIAILVGVIGGSLVNMALIVVSGDIIPPPPGADVTTMEGLQASLHLFSPKHFIMPWLAHALGTFIGAFLAALLAPVYKMRYALSIGLFFLLGGIVNVFMLKAPLWFLIIDLGLAYLPMSYLGGLLIRRHAQKTQRRFL